MKWLLIEEYTPEDGNFIENAIEEQDCGEIYTPSVGFLEKSYKKLNKLFFDDRLPNDIKFKIEYDKASGGSGHTDADNNKDQLKFDIHYISLNGTLMKSPHSWIETILHEMIHVDDFTNHPAHFSGDYNEHGEWFVKQAKRFEKFGFHIGVKDMDDNIQASVDNEMVRRKFKRGVFIAIGKNPISGVVAMVKVDLSDKELALSALKKENCKEVSILSTKNLNSALIPEIEVSDIGNIQYNITDGFNKKYGPFEEVETIDLTKLTIDESKLNNMGWKSTMTVVKLPNGRMHIHT